MDSEAQQYVFCVHTTRMWAWNIGTSNDKLRRSIINLSNSVTVNSGERQVKEVKQETNYKLVDCSSPNFNWKDTSLKLGWQSIAQLSPYWGWAVTGFRQSWEDNAKLFHPPRTETLQIMSMHGRFLCVCPTYNKLREELHALSTVASCTFPQVINLSVLTSMNTVLVNSLCSKFCTLSLWTT